MSKVNTALTLLTVASLASVVYQNRPIEASERYTAGRQVQDEILQGAYDVRGLFAKHCIDIDTAYGERDMRAVAEANPKNFTYSDGANRNYAAPLLHEGKIKMIERCN